MNFVDFVIIIGVALIVLFHIMLHKKRPGLSAVMLDLLFWRGSAMTFVDALLLAEFPCLVMYLMFLSPAALPKGVLLGYVIAAALADVLSIKFINYKNNKE